jgi:hypothetical protein
MIPSNTGSVAEELPQEKAVVPDCSACGPMVQQDIMGSHGHEMHPQKLVQLVGCHASKAGKPPAGRPH